MKSLTFTLLCLLFPLSICIGQRPNTNEADSLSFAEIHLAKIANKKERQRKVLGITALGVGTASIIGGSILISESDEDDFLKIDQGLGTLLIVQGVVGTIFGGIKLLVLSEAEQRNYNVRSISGI